MRINFRFWLLVRWSSRGPDASSHIIWCKISLSSLELLTFFRNSRWRPPPYWIFSLREFGYSGMLTVWYLFSVPNLVQISVIVTEIDAHMLQNYIWWRHANSLPVSTFAHVVISAWPRCIFPWYLVQISLSNPELLIFFSKIKDGRRPHLGFVWVSHGTTHKASFVVRTSCTNFFNDRLGSFQVITIWFFFSSGLKVLFTPQKYQFWGDFTTKI